VGACPGVKFVVAEYTSPESGRRRPVGSQLRGVRNEFGGVSSARIGHGALRSDIERLCY